MTTFSRILPKRREAGVDLGLGLGAQANHLGIAATLEVEDAPLRPAVFIIADELIIRTRGQGGFTGAGEAEEEGGFATVILVGRAVHAHDAPLRQQVVQQREDGLLELAGVSGAADEDALPAEMEDDECLRAGVVAFGHSAEPGGINEVPLRLEGGALLRIGFADEHVAGEQAVPRQLGDHSHREAKLPVGAGVEILDEDVAIFEMRSDPIEERIEVIGLERYVHIAPPHIRLR